MTTLLENKVALVTGAGSGMGKAIAIAFANEGAKVMLADFNADSLAEVKDIIEAADQTAETVTADMSKPTDVGTMVKETVAKFGQLDILVNNAGIMDDFKTVGTTTDELWNRVMAVNLTGPFQACREAINIMKDQPNGGVIINNASVGGLFGARGGAAYAASKHGLIG
ncbi:MAG TPA: 3-ketoacyl-ACP reductase, partial [Lactobacillus sp.]|nr:3-ketoacyl-ACP reductase [Lactobacillus sp.]